MSSPGSVEYVRADDLLAEPVQELRAAGRALSRNRHLAGAALAICGLPVLTLLLTHATDTLSIESVVLLYLLAVVLVAVTGGIAVAVVSAVAAAFLINYYFVRPVHTLHVAQGEQVLTLVVFLVVAVLVSGLVEIAERRARTAERARREAETLSGLAGGDPEEPDTLHALLDRARSTFAMESVALRARDHQTGEWYEVDQAGWAPEGEEAALRFDLPIGTDLRLIGRGPALFAEDQRVLKAFSAAVEAAFAGRRLSARAREARALEAADRQRTSLLAAVGHDLRTPLAVIKASASTLGASDLDPSPAERGELLASIEESADRLESIVANLLDASRLQAGALSVHTQPVALDEVVGSALLAVHDAGRVSVDIPEDLPLVQADPGLLERVLANVIDNAIRHGGDGGPVEVSATAGESSAKLKVVDHGPGVPAAERELMFEPFRGSDRTSKGVGLGLTVARGFTEAMGGVLIADGAGDGGLTMRLRLPLAPARDQ